MPDGASGSDDDQNDTEFSIYIANVCRLTISLHHDEKGHIQEIGSAIMEWNMTKQLAKINRPFPGGNSSLRGSRVISFKS